MKIEPKVHIIEDGKALTFIKYYAIRYKVDVEYQHNREMVYAFKDGNFNPVLYLFEQGINKLKEVNPSKDYHLCIIPASTMEKSKRRFEKFCTKLSSVCKIKNGYDLLTACEDRDPVHTGEGRDYSSLLDCIEFGDVEGKDIILCDDVLTRGKSYKIVRKQLLELGAKSVIGVMLAKTDWIEEVPAPTILPKPSIPKMPAPDDDLPF